MSGKVDSIKVRMYNTGSVGDCILLRFYKGTTLSFKMLIDCGGYKTNTAAVMPCANDIITVCGGKLDLLVVTHQHEDHISGFNLGRSAFDSIAVEEVWMSWVENPVDPIAIILKDKYGKKVKQLKRSTEQAITKLKRLATNNNFVKGAKRSQATRLANKQQALELLEFEEGRSHGPHLGVGKKTNDDAMKYVKGKGKKMEYRIPGQVIKNMKGAEGVRFHILGPPRDKDLKYLKIEMQEDEIYHLTAGAQADASPMTERIIQSGVTLQDYVSSFGHEYKLSSQELKSTERRYKSPDYKWRQIETDWLETGNEVALALTDYLNNTSLAMAIEFEESEAVMLFPADAQSGNWMSWFKTDVMKDLKTNGGKDTKELLAKTIFYKVGHHGSHNGTASKSGLEMIPDTDLVAIMPLVQDKVPTAWGGADNFPAKKLYRAIIQKTKGRTIRTDEGLISDKDAQKLRSLLPASKQKELQKAITKGSNFYEYTVKP